FPECTFTSNFNRGTDGKITLEEAAATALNLTCPQCGKTLVQRRGKFGTFIACPGYPECKYIHQDKLKMPCPSCKGDIVKRRWRGGSFWGCSNYPKCKFSIFGEVKESPCPKCKLPYVAVIKNKSDGSEKFACTNKECGWSE
ncbi:MAG: topoisomerase DNA-binding C4 zinc finger domain-containing protein, partial [Candidatus Babeliales bacterium]